MKMHELREHFVPWAGLVVGILGFGFAHQFGSDSVFNDCEVASPVPLLVAAVSGIGVTVVAALVSWRVFRNRGEGPARRLIAIISVGSAALLVFATLLPMIASLVLPPCFK